MDETLLLSAACDGDGVSEALPNVLVRDPESVRLDDRVKDSVSVRTSETVSVDVCDALFAAEGVRLATDLDSVMDFVTVSVPVDDTSSEALDKVRLTVSVDDGVYVIRVSVTISVTEPDLARLRVCVPAANTGVPARSATRTDKMTNGRTRSRLAPWRTTASDASGTLQV